MRLYRRVPRAGHADIAQRVRQRTPVRELAADYGVCCETIYKILHAQGIWLGDGDTASPDEAWVRAHLEPYEDPDTRDWLGAQLRAFLERWHEKEG